MRCVKLCKLSFDAKDYYLLMSESDEEPRFSLLLTDGVDAWRGSVTDDDLMTWAEKTTLGADELEMTRKALAGESFERTTFDYQLKATERRGRFEFIWKKVVEREGVKFQLGSASMQQEADPSAIVKRIFDHAIDAVKTLGDDRRTLEEERDRWKGETASALEQLESFATVKGEMEKSLYAKFVVVLNDKKSKLRELKSKLENHKDTPSSSRSVGESKHYECEDAMIERHSSIGSDYDTDEERKLHSSTRNIHSSKNETPSKSDRNRKESDLMLDADDDTEMPATSKRQRVRETKKTVPVPLMPGTSSSKVRDVQKLKSNTSTTLKTRKSGSAATIDEDDLLDDMA